MRVLYLEDEELLASAVKHNLEKRGFDVDLACDGEVGLAKAKRGSYDCMVFDVVMPKLSGLEVLRALRASGDVTPVIILSALSEVEDKVRGLEQGADDYLAKPFKTVELVARMKALMRRPAQIKSNVLEFGDLRFDEEGFLLTCGENEIILTAKEAKLLRELMKGVGRVKNKEYLLNKIWGDEEAAEDNYVEVYMSRLRKSLKQVGSVVKITTIRGAGYKLEAENV